MVAAHDIERVEVVRGGAGLRVTRAGGGARTVRYKELAYALGVPRAHWVLPAVRIRTARVIAEGLELTHADGSVEPIPARLLPGAAAAVAAELIIEHASLMTCAGEGDDPLGLLTDGAICLGGGRVLWLGPSRALPHCGLALGSAHRVDARGRLVSPGLVDPHAHPIFAGQRAAEFARRARGESYLDIAAAGGGIAATLGPTRAADVDQHVALAAARMARALAAGTTTCEAKSGYDLTVDGELRLLEAAAIVDATQPVDLVPTLLGAHLVPPERRADRAGYVADVAERMVPAAAARELCTSVDVYCDEGAFTLAEARVILSAARRAGLPVRGHAGQFADLGAAELIAELGGLSADHLEHVSAAGIAALAAHSVVAVMLPGACVQLGLPPPPVAALRAAGVALAIGSDLNPGSSMSETLPIQMWLACAHYKMTVEEAWLGVTRQAARALGRHDLGTLIAGAAGDLVMWDAETPAEVPYHYGVNLVAEVVKAGRLV